MLRSNRESGNERRRGSFELETMFEFRLYLASNWPAPCGGIAEKAENDFFCGVVTEGVGLVAKCGEGRDVGTGGKVR